MGAKDDAIAMFEMFQQDSWFQDAFYPASWTETITTGNAFGGGSVSTVVHSFYAMKVGSKDIIKFYGQGADMSSLYIKCIIDEVGSPVLGTQISIDGRTMTISDQRSDSVNALVMYKLAI